MYPNGFVFAAASTSHTSMPRSFANIATSFTNAMFTWRKVFSSSLVSSATRVLATGMVTSTNAS